MNKKILIVEDEFVVAIDLRLTLTDAGYTVMGIAVSAEEAEEYLKDQKPDLVLLDIQLYGTLSGIDLARKLSVKNIAFIYLSANSSQTVLEEAKKTEPYGFLVKPFREKDLIVAIDIALYRQKIAVESRLLQESLLQKQLSDIANETSEAKQKFLKIAQALRSFIPFDLLVSGPRTLQAQQLQDSGYLRVGFDEYQFIGQRELMTIAGLNEKSISKIIAESDEKRHDGVNAIGNTDDTPATALQKIWFNAFKIESFLTFNLKLSNGDYYHYCFQSRQRELYTQKHLNVLNLFTKCLTNVSDSMMKSAPFMTPLLDQRPKLIQVDAGNGVPAFNGIIGQHPLLLTALDLTAQVAAYNTSVLVLGESGTGKERIARSIHLLSTRAQGPFVEVNCGAIPATLIESELFGHEKGAFTGAIEKRKGKFEQADGGTIFLDEIGELPTDMQVKLLRVLQEREFEYVGGSSTKKVNVRVVAATNRNLEKEVAEGNFRLDLYYRLNVFPITLPSLRERKSDIEALAVFFASKFCKEFNKDFKGIDPAMLHEMHSYHWPGNIRELENVLEQSVILNDGRSRLTLKRTLDVTSPPPGRASVENFDDLKHIQQETEREFIISVLKRVKGRIRGANGAAELLNIKPTTLESKMARLGIKGDDF